jgi:hypothetical protein
MNTPKVFFEDQAVTALGNWDKALSKMMPAVPFDQDKRDAAKIILKDERIANDLFVQRHTAHLQEGMDDVTARKQAAADLTEFARRVGGK